MHNASEWQGFIKASWAPLARVMSKLRSRQGRVAPQGHTAVWQQRGWTQSRRPPPRVGVFRLKGCPWLHLSNGGGGGFRCCRQQVSLEEAGGSGWEQQALPPPAVAQGPAFAAPRLCSNPSQRG